MRVSAVPSTRRKMVALTLALAALPALAQAHDSAATAWASPPSNPAAQQNAPARPALPVNESAMLGQALMFDPASLSATGGAKPLRLPRLPNSYGLAVSRTERPDGSSTVVVKQPLSRDWDANVGADLGLGPAPSASIQPDKPLAVQSDRTSGAAWASLGVPNLATVDARIDPTNDQGRLGTTFKHSIPVGNQFSVTLQDSYSVTETFGTRTSTAPSAPPVSALPQDTTAGTGPSQVWGNQPAVKFDILPTGTTLTAGLNSSSTDPVTHNSLSADQKLLGPLHVTTAVTDIGQPTTNESITAGFKLNW
jgi:hypothetical protein